MPMFKGYVLTNGKIPKSALSEGLLDTPPQIGDFGGLLQDDIIMIDVDSRDDADIIHNIIKDKNVKCNILETDRGKHFYFKNKNPTGAEVIKTNKIKTNTSLGITIDVKLGSKNTVVPLRVKGGMRLFKLIHEELDPLPCWLIPVKHTNVFHGLKEGDGRDQLLFNYILTLQSNSFDKNDIIDTLNIINEYMFDDPIETSRMEIICRDEAFQKPIFFKDKTFQHDTFAKYLIQKYHVVKIDGQLHYYENGVYNKFDSICSKMIEEIPTLKKAQRNEVWHYINDLITTRTQQASPKYICLNNGIYDMSNNVIFPHSPEYIFTNKIPVNYNKCAKSKLIDDTFDKLTCKNMELTKLLFEIIGYCFYRRNEIGKFFIFTGEGGTGKSTYIKLIKTLIGEDNCSAVSMHNVCHRFNQTSVVGKLVNLGDDISDQYIQDDSDFKKIVSGDTMEFEHKYGTPFKNDVYCKQIFSANKLPNVHDKSDGFLRRFIPVPFRAKKFRDATDYDPFIVDKLTSSECLEYLVLKGIEGLKDVLINNDFTIDQDIRDEIADFKACNDPLIEFFEDTKILNEPVANVYIAYLGWCHSSGLKWISKNMLSAEIKRRFGYKSKSTSIGGESMRIYTE